MTLQNAPTPTNLYRIVSFDRAAEIITGRKLYFAHPSKWDDPYEKVLQHEKARAIFAQCWCRKALSDAMWRIYSPHGLGVRLATTRQRLHRALTAAKATRKIDFRIQNVEYLFQEELDFKVRDVGAKLAKKYSLHGASEPLFLKRKAFDHEREARVVVFDPASLNGEFRAGITVDVDPFEVITSIWIDPRAPNEVVNAYRFYLKEKLAFPGTVAKSKLYEAPNALIVQGEA